MKLPLCFKCQRQVEELVETPIFPDGGVSLTAVCHGERETVTISGADLARIQVVSLDKPRVDFGYAFMPKELRPPCPALP